LVAVNALITAGGKGTRIKELGIEKPMILVDGLPLIEHVLRAVRDAATIKGIYVSVSDNTPQTRRYLEEHDVQMIHTSGTDYCEDLKAAMGRLRTEQVFVCPADLPLITPQAIDEIVESYATAGVGSYSVAVPHRILQALGIVPTFRFEVEGVDTVLCGVSVVDRHQMLSVDRLEEGYMVTESVDLAINVNSRGDLQKAEELLKKRR
jgi:adenosylcobinamide-phosphate guanylyltransferase